MAAKLIVTIIKVQKQRTQKLLKKIILLKIKEKNIRKGGWNT
jgi:hypothetical protein